MDKIKVAIVGFEDITKSYYSDLRRSDYFELVGISKQDSSKNLPDIKAQIYQSVDELYSYHSPEALIITTPANIHKKTFLQCQKYAKNFLIHAPLSTNIGEINEMAYIAKENNLKVCIGYNTRFNPTIISLKQALKKEEQIYSINIIHSSTYPKDTFGGIKMSITMSDLDLIRYISSSEISEFCVSTNSIKDKDIEDVLCAKTKTTNGIICSITNSWNYKIDRFCIEISCSSGHYMADLVAFNLRKMDDKGLINLRVDNEDMSIRFQNSEFFKYCMSGDIGNLVSINDAIAISKVIL
ncbi:MAG: Gfo/Idh/MocA family oxidoreductase [Campylobacter sputorum]|uniref:Gfo/Idh/MocA family protein n=1 Tax=Campylobacter sputorum TaxID=206 RepID=UPI000B792DC4|nr:Gfo/Idh/MocA family oxidoreductase [Campylobacter sputorum]ASM38709.1 putative dehydrogenase [Campylobacter sputorum bv. paraureolyticus LMG 11764]MDY6120639.1 Gfo/Idh/MocA family oxidoreductase [Campylobacter sputorum]